VPCREAIPEDAQRLIAPFETLYAKTKFLLSEPGESIPLVERYAARIGEGSKAGSEFWFVAETAGQLIGVCFARRGFAKRNRHSLFLVMGVLEAWSGRGIGRALLQAIEQSALSRAIHRLELTVNTRNARAMTLYEKFGFVCEGTKRHSLFVDGEYIDELYMAKLLAP
jgi:RimJ/RimL family protein N-acetyltransferase